MYTCNYTIEAYTADRFWSVWGCESKPDAIKSAMRRIRRRGGTVKIWYNDHLVWQRG